MIRKLFMQGKVAGAIDAYAILLHARICDRIVIADLETIRRKIDEVEIADAAFAEALTSLRRRVCGLLAGRSATLEVCEGTQPSDSPLPSPEQEYQEDSPDRSSYVGKPGDASGNPARGDPLKNLDEEPDRDPKESGDGQDGHVEEEKDERVDARPRKEERIGTKDPRDCP